MEEVNWYVGARVSRSRGGNVHWFVESSDGLSHGNLVDEGNTDSLLDAIIRCRMEVFSELLRLEGTQPVNPSGM